MSTRVGHVSCRQKCYGGRREHTDDSEGCQDTSEIFLKVMRVVGSRCRLVRLGIDATEDEGVGLGRILLELDAFTLRESEIDGAVERSRRVENLVVAGESEEGANGAHDSLRLDAEKVLFPVGRKTRRGKQGLQSRRSYEGFGNGLPFVRIVASALEQSNGDDDLNIDGLVLPAADQLEREVLWVETREIRRGETPRR